MTLCDIDEKIKTRPSLIEFSLQQLSDMPYQENVQLRECRSNRWRETHRKNRNRFSWFMERRND